MKFEMDFMPTEDKARLENIIKNVFPDADYKVGKSKIIGKTDGKRFHELVDQQQITQVINAELEKGYVDLSKSAALVSKISVDQGSETGKIRLYR